MGCGQCIACPMKKTQFLALCASVPLASADGVPEWIHLLPAGEIRTRDGRGPYRVASMSTLATLKDGQKLAIDECHAIDKGQALGAPGRAVGWIVELQSRDDGLWGRVEWNRSGTALMEDQAYSGVSPVIRHTKDGQIVAIARASLTNTPNLEGLTALHMEEVAMDWRSMLIELLGLDSEVDDAAIDAALRSKMGTHQAEFSQLLASPEVVALQSQLTDVTNQLNALQQDRSREAAAAFVDGAIAEGRVGVKPLRDTYIALHMENADRAKEMIGAMPVIGGQTRSGDLPPVQTATGELDADDRHVMALMGVSEEDYKARQKAMGLTQEAI